MINTPHKTTFLITGLLLITSLKSFSQKSDGTTASLIKTEKYLNELTIKKGINKAFIKMADKRGVVYRPNPVNIIEYYGKQEPAKYQLNWKPDFAMISKDGHFGFTTGPYEFSKDGQTTYGHYLSIWKAGSNKKWKLFSDAGIDHPKPKNDIESNFIDPSNYKYPKLMGPVKLKMREDMVLNTDILFGKALKNTGNKNFNEFYDDDVRLFFPGEQPLVGKQNAIAFIDKKQKAITSQPTFVDRALSGDLAFTNGKAEIADKKYNYIRVWRISAEMKWNVLIDLYMEE
jgi:ketosteroid isomerase-like protein